MIVQCPFCHYKEAVPEEYAGMIGECSNCGKEFRIQKPMSFQQPMYAQQETQGEGYPILCFVLAFLFSVIGLLVAYVIDKKNLKKAVIGFFCGFILEIMVCMVACSSFSNQKKVLDARDTIREIEAAAEMYLLSHSVPPKSVDMLVGPSNYIKDNGKVKDPWGTTYKIEIGDFSSPIIISAGPDKKFGTPDDIRSDSM